MKRIILIGFLILSLLIISCVNQPDNNTEKDQRCSMPKPTEEGGCEILRGFYYDQEQNKCISIGGCSTEGEIPFTVFEFDECNKICANEVSK